MAEVAVETNPKWMRKGKNWATLNKAFDEYKNVLIIGVDFVGSNQMQKVRIALRGKGLVVMGKNTIIRKVIRERVGQDPKMEALLPYVYGNVGFVFTNGDLSALRQIITAHKVPAGAKTGVVAPIDVVIPPGPTGLDPGQTGFFQTLSIGTRIVKGAIEMTTASKVCTKGEKITASAVALLNKLNIRPFEYGITIDNVYENGSCYAAKVLDMSENDLINMFARAANRLAAVSFALGHVNQATLPHSFGRAFRVLCAVALETGYEFDELKAVKEQIAGNVVGPCDLEEKMPPRCVFPEPAPEEPEDPLPIGDLFGEGKKGDY